MGNCLSSKSVANGELENLPDDIYRFLFKYLHLDDIWTLRLVSKSLYSIVKKYDITELLFLKDDHHDGYKDKWFSTSKLIKFRNSIDSSKLDLLRSPWPNVLNLRCLKLEMCPLLFRLEDLNKFTKLEILEIHNLKICFDHRLQLPELNALSISTNGRNSGCLQFQTPKLHRLGINSDFQYKLVDSKIKFNDSSSIKHLKASKFDQSFLAFANLECLEIENDKNDDLNLLMDVLKFSNLKRLRINTTIRSKGDSCILNDLFTLKSDDLEIVLEGVRIKENDTIDEYGETADKLRFQLDNYGELEDDLDFVRLLNYDDLINLLPFYQPSNLFGKYNSIQQLIVNSRVEDEIRLVDFIKNCRNLYNLELKDAALNQRFYDKLPKISLLSKLSISRNSFNLDFKFLTNIPYLICLITDQDVTVEHLKDLKYLRSFEFKIVTYLDRERKLGRQEHLFKVHKMSRYKYRVESVDMRLPKKYYLFNEMVDLIHKARNMDL